MKTAIYPGSFNPLHKGHVDIINKALQVFDKIIVARGVNGSKANETFWEWENQPMPEFTRERITFTNFTGLLVDYISSRQIDAVIRGLRNGADLQYEMNLQYNNEDLGLTIPVVYFITDRTLGHISSSSIREIKKIKEGVIKL